MSNFHANAITVNELYKRWEFHHAVFSADEARKEERLDEVLELPPWFFEVLGSIYDKDFLVVVGMRGAGKSALRRSISLHCESEIGSDEILGGTVLCITVDHDTSHWVRSSFSSGLYFDSFCSEIADRIVLGILSHEKEELHRLLNQVELAKLERYLRRLSYRKPDEVKILLEKTRSRASRAKALLDSEIVKDVVRVGTALAGSEVDLSKYNSTVDTAMTLSSYEDITDLVVISKKCGFDLIYILVDELDEYNETAGNPRKSAELLAPIITSIGLLEKEGIAFKFFLSNPVFRELINLCNENSLEIRWDRTSHSEPYYLSWSNLDIKEMLKKRLIAYSENIKKASLAKFCVPGLSDKIDDEIMKYAFGSPRHFIQLCSKIAFHTARVANKNSNLITEEIFQIAVKEFSERVCKELYGEMNVNTITDLGIINFTEIELMEKFRDVRKELVDNFINTLVINGGIERKTLVGSVEYRVSDPRLLLLIESTRK